MTGRDLALRERRFVLVRRERLPAAWLDDIIPAGYAWTWRHLVIFPLACIVTVTQAIAVVYFACSLF